MNALRSYALITAPISEKAGCLSHVLQKPINKYKLNYGT
jgi:hypothetical protein